MDNRMSLPLIFTLGSNPSLSKRVSSLLNLPLSPVKVAHFADGEIFAKPLCDVSGRDCFIIHSTFRPVSERLMDLLVFIDALSHAHARHITAIIPYFGYARQDRIIDPGDPISGLLVAKMLQTAGVNEIITVDFHSKNLFAQFPMAHTNLCAIPLFAKEFLKHLSENHISPSEVCAVSPDHGGVNRVKTFAAFFPQATFAYAEKHRPEPNKASVEAVHGDVKGKLCIVVDDIIDTAGTLSEVVKALFAHGAKEVWAAATHGVFSGRAIELIKESGIKMLLVADTIESPTPFGETVSIAPLLEAAIKQKLSLK